MRHLIHACRECRQGLAWLQRRRAIPRREQAPNEIIKVFSMMAPATKARELVAGQMMPCMIPPPQQALARRRRRRAVAHRVGRHHRRRHSTIGFTFILYMEFTLAACAAPSCRR